MNEPKIKGNIFSFNTAIIGSVNNDADFIKNIEQKGYYNLNLNSLSYNSNPDLELKTLLNLNDYTFSNKLQCIILSNVVNLVKSGHKKLILNNIITFVDTSLKCVLLEFLKKNEVTYINITSDMEEVLYSEYLVVIYQDKVALEGNTLEVLNEEKLLTRMGFKLPFIIDISIQLKYYGLIDKIYTTKEDLVSVLWK